MICVLCYESNDEFISVDSKRGRQLKIATLLYKYFQFCFDYEPSDGDLCVKCWSKTLAFHEFYAHIESVHHVINKDKDALELPPEPMKIELNEPSLKGEIDDTTFDDNGWSFHSDPDELSSPLPSPDFIDDPPDKDDIFQQQTSIPNTGTTKMETSTELSSQNVKTEKSTKDNKKIPKSTSKRKSKKTSRGRPKNPVMHTCKIRMCLEEFESIEALISHKTTAHRRIQCTHCPDLKLVVDLNKHLRTTHGIMQNSMCEHCGQVYMNTRSLQDHIQRKHEVSEPLQCDICKEWFKSRDTIRAHMNYVHVQGPQACPICGKISANRKALRKHQTIHMDSWKDRYKCIICGRGFRDSTKLKEHSYIHSGITDAYFCQFCGQSFRFGSSLSAHRMRYHPDEMAHVKERLQRKKNLEFKV